MANRKARWSVQKTSADNNEYIDSQLLLMENDFEKFMSSKLAAFEPQTDFIIRDRNNTSRKVAEFSDWIELYRTVDMHNKPIKNLLNPTDDTDAATKQYVNERSPKGDLYEGPALALTDKESYQTFALKTVRDPTISTLIGNRISLETGTYKILIVGNRTEGSSFTVKLILAENQTLRGVDVTKQPGFDFSHIMILQGHGEIILQAKKLANENVKARAVLLIEKI